MYIIDKDKNRIKAASRTTFSELGFKERQHLQEWIANSPSCLGEELLIIQKEFNGFDDTNERLDLLALDKNGNLVVIENKLDDSGKDVTWQAIKYASFCCSLTKSQVIDIYKKYLQSIASNEDAEKNLLDFFEKVSDIDELALNKGNSQRIIFVAANFRKEVTSAVLWLMNFGVNCMCVQVTPFRHGDALMVDFNQIIPTKGTEEYTICISEKKKEENQVSESASRRHDVRFKFWQEFIQYNQSVNGDFATSSPVSDNWIGKGGIMSGVSVNVVITTKECRTEVYFNTGSQDKNKSLFDAFYTCKSRLEELIGDALSWERMDDKVTCRACLRKPYGYQNESEKQAIFELFVHYTRKFVSAFHDVAQTLSL